MENYKDPDLKEASVNHKDTCIRKRGNPREMELENPKKPRMKESNTENQAILGEGQQYLLKEGNKFSRSREKPVQENVITRNSLTQKEVLEAKSASQDIANEGLWQTPSLVLGKVPVRKDNESVVVKTTTMEQAFPRRSARVTPDVKPGNDERLSKKKGNKITKLQEVRENKMEAPNYGNQEICEDGKCSASKEDTLNKGIIGDKKGMRKSVSILHRSTMEESNNKPIISNQIKDVTGKNKQKVFKGKDSKKRQEKHHKQKHTEMSQKAGKPVKENGSEYKKTKENIGRFEMIERDHGDTQDVLKGKTEKENNSAKENTKESVKKENADQIEYDCISRMGGDHEKQLESKEEDNKTVPVEMSTGGKHRMIKKPKRQMSFEGKHVQNNENKEEKELRTEKVKEENEAEKQDNTMKAKKKLQEYKTKSETLVSKKEKKRKKAKGEEEGVHKLKESKIEYWNLEEERQRERRDIKIESEESGQTQEEKLRGSHDGGKKNKRQEKSRERNKSIQEEALKGRNEAKNKFLVKKSGTKDKVKREELLVNELCSMKKEKKKDKEMSKTPKEENEKGKKKRQEEESKWKWWQEEKSEDGVKWKQLEHKGPYFAPLYEPLPDEVHFFYDGKAMKLSLATEEIATFYGKMLDHEYTTKEVFQNNFFSDWRKEMTMEEKKIIKHLDKCDFTEIHKYFVDKNEARKALPKEEKQKLKEEAERLQEEFGYCILDGHREKIGNFKTEPPGLFRGRGDHPKMGMLKKRIMPEDVIINCSRDSKIPEPPPGHKWKEVRFDNTVTWLASWTENIQNSIKYIMLNPSSKLKGEKDWQKYEVARRLKGVVDKIRFQYRFDWKSREMKKRQRAVALYFIDKLALRAGNEKEEGETADTVGCCSLRVEHIQLHEELDGQKHVVEFDFLGKDSIRYYNKVPVEKPVFQNLQLFMENKDPGDDLFDRLNTSTLNKHLQDLMDGLTAKVFRTYNASITLQEQLKALTNAEDNIAAKILSYNRANRAVAILCNHQRATPKTFEKSMQNLQTKIDAKKEQLVMAKQELKRAKADSKVRKDVKSKSNVDKKKKLLARLEEQLMKLYTQATDKEENKQVALATSKLNYLDPRISVAWCKKFGVPVEKIYNKTQREKFAWAIDMADEEFEF
ncbi:DNA topoisomerase I, mitochondrial [Petaurus breviceps papuanus]|uniref:DNA topoisomerase I, mitochondrial n=1 Tax=Petaurus breviceps papuanus TaxID=3040969 RepID=UPI0036D9F839